MMRRLSAWFDACSAWYTVLASAIVYGLFLALVMTPHAQEMQALTTEWGAPDGHLFYTPDTLYGELARWQPAGREHYIDFRLGLDPVWALVYASFLIVVTSVALKRAYPEGHPRRLLNLSALLPMLADIGENFLGIALVAAWPERMDALAWLTASVTLFKWTTLVLAHLVMLFAIGAALRARRGA